MGLLELRVLWIGTWGRRLGREMSEQEVSRGLRCDLCNKGSQPWTGRRDACNEGWVKFHRVGPKVRAGWGLGDGSYNGTSGEVAGRLPEGAGYRD